jgi:hypothetical protein
MKYLLAALLAFGLIDLSYPILAASSNCNSVLAQSKATLPNVRFFKVINIDKFQGDAPRGRSKQLNISIDGEKGEKYMGVSSLQLAMTKKIVVSCPQIAIVAFNKYETDWVNMYGLVNGKVQKFVCKDVGEKITWGEYTCL